jgi:hypothetical protein
MLPALPTHHPAFLNVYIAQLPHAMALYLSSCSPFCLYSTPTQLLPHTTYNVHLIFCSLVLRTPHLLFCSLILHTMCTSSSAPSCYLHCTTFSAPSYYLHCTPPHLLPHTTYTAHLLFCSLILPTLHLPFCSPCYLHYTSICSSMLPTFHSAPSCYLALTPPPLLSILPTLNASAPNHSMLHTLHTSLHPYCLGYTAQFYSHMLPTLQCLWCVNINNEL